MERYLRHFRREGWGIWVCVEAVRLELPDGEVEVPAGAALVAGTKFNGIDVAMLLETERAKGRRA